MALSSQELEPPSNPGRFSTATALVLTSVLAGIVERTWGLPISEGLAPVALIVGAMGNGWRPIFQALGAIVQTWAGERGRK